MSGCRETKRLVYISNTNGITCTTTQRQTVGNIINQDVSTAAARIINRTLRAGFQTVAAPGQVIFRGDVSCQTHFFRGGGGGGGGAAGGGGGG